MTRTRAQKKMGPAMRTPPVLNSDDIWRTLGRSLNSENTPATSEQTKRPF